MDNDIATKEIAVSEDKLSRLASRMKLRHRIRSEYVPRHFLSSERQRDQLRYVQALSEVCCFAVSRLQ